jgi:O-antigen ligase
MSLPEVSFRTLTTPRRAHSLYFEMAAELGALGLMAFLIIPALLARRLWKLRALAVRLAPHQARVATAFLLAMMAYFTTAFFLHLAFQPYYWFLMALCTAATHCLETSAKSGWAKA